jgi:hypothetical protein
MILISLLLVIVAMATLVAGAFFASGLMLVYVSIGTCLVAGGFLVAGVLRDRSRRKEVTASGGSPGQPAAASWSGASSWAPGPQAEESEGGEPAAAGSDGDEAAAESAGAETEPAVEVVTAQQAEQAAESAGVAVGGAAAGAAASGSTAGTATAGTATAPSPGSAADGEAEAGADDEEEIIVVPAQETSAEETPAQGPSETPTATPPPDSAEADRLAEELGSVSGLGPAKRTRLLEEFGTVDEIRAASQDQLAAIRGISAMLASRIQDALHGHPSA